MRIKIYEEILTKHNINLKTEKTKRTREKKNGKTLLKYSFLWNERCSDGGVSPRHSALILLRKEEKAKLQKGKT